MVTGGILLVYTSKYYIQQALFATEKKGIYARYYDVTKSIWRDWIAHVIYE